MADIGSTPQTNLSDRGLITGWNIWQPSSNPNQNPCHKIGKTFHNWHKKIFLPHLTLLQAPWFLLTLTYFFHFTSELT